MNHLRILKIATLIISILASNKLRSQERPQTPQEPLPYQSINVNYQVREDTSVHLAATLTLPNGKGPFKAILIIGGSGQTSRNQPIYNHQMMFVLSDFLTKMGFATLRFDDRGAGKSTAGPKKFSQMTESDYLDDARAGIEFLKHQDQIDKDRIGVIGHSAGATQGLILATEKTSNIWFSIMLAGAVNNYPHMIVAQQSKLMAKASGHSLTMQLADSSFIARSIQYTTTEANYEKRRQEINRVAEEELQKLTPSEQDKLRKSFETRVKILSSEQFYTAAQQEQEDQLLKVKCPVLIILGGNDLNVDANFYGPNMLESLERNFNPKSRLVILPEISHLMQRSKTGLFDEAKDISETISVKVLDSISAWLGLLEN
ncbi:S9 family peptidase [Sphingobacterium sp. 18053]|uniref:alpha/beta hydrolase family protein n=1 Tax=Sphingobacterium sp. 18053 TaxID=2681401 RepID=UPI00135CA085|nr:alpha/beta fold hydrolase [Sphingobacterium sp. 18053]